MEQAAGRPRGSRAAGRPVSGLAALVPLFDYLYCLLVSIVLFRQPLLGGALYLAAQVAGMCARVFREGVWALLDRGPRILGIALGGLSALLSLGLILIYPLYVELPRLWLLFGIIALLRLRGAVNHRIHLHMLQHGGSRARRMLRLFEATLAISLGLALLLFLSLQTDTAWYLLGGFVLASLLETAALLAAGGEKRPGLLRSLPEHAGEAPEKGINSLKVYLQVSAISTVALQVTLILSYTLIGTSAGGLLLCMGIAFVCTWLPERIVAALLRQRRKRQRDQANLLLAGLTLWLLSLLFLGLYLDQRPGLWAYVALVSLTAGASLTLNALQSLSSDMPGVLRFAGRPADEESWAAIQGCKWTFFSLLGQMLALLALALLLFLGGGQKPGMPELQPALIIPALLLVGAALLSAFRFPMEQKHFRKLHSFLQSAQQGEQNLPLQQQLEDVVVKLSRRRYGIKLFILCLKPFFPARAVGREKVKLDPDAACIFTCNHSEIYGPVVANLYVPFNFRTWVISEMVAPEQIADYIYTYTFSRQKWMPRRWKKPLSRFFAPMLHWMMESIECIPVYRNHPRELINTFKQSAAAMEAGDNLLIFPENPNHESQEQAGYLRDGIGPFFQGFVTVAQLYHKRTGKRALFYPIYADKKKRRLYFGEPIRYDADNLPKDEQVRVSNHLRREMLRLGGFAMDEEAAS